MTRPLLYPRMSEADVDRAVADAAALGGWLRYHTHDSRRSPSGFPDLVLVRERVLFVELKGDGGRVSPEQALWIDRLRDAGAWARVVGPAQLDELVDLLRRRAPRGFAGGGGSIVD